MADVFSRSMRSEVMSRIRGRGNKATEMAFMRLLRLNRISGWRRHLPIICRNSNDLGQSKRGRRSSVIPDFVFRRPRVAVFIDGCFWHGCPRHATSPKSNADFWQTKLASNRTRDSYVTRELRKRNWTVIRIWEHQLCQGGPTMARFKRQLALAAETRGDSETREPPIRPRTNPSARPSCPSSADVRTRPRH
jgi:DNA mismatch endonuclease (patch repair protein)